MPKIKLSARTIAALAAPDPSGRPVLHWDTELTGFGVLCSGRTATKSFIVQRDLAGHKTRRITLGATNVLTLDAARKAAQIALAGLYQGKDPKQVQKSESTLADTLAHYLANTNLRPGSIRAYRLAVERYLAAWRDLPLRNITRDMVTARHKDIAAEIEERHSAAESGKASRYSGEVTANLALRVLRILWNHEAERVQAERERLRLPAERMPDLPSNPVRGLKKQWNKVPRRKRLVRDEELPAFWTAVQGLENAVARDYLTLLLFTGLRRSEAASLRWNDIDLGKKVICLPAARTKAKRDLDLPMTDIVHDLLVKRRALGREQLERERFVFPSNSKSGHIEEPDHPLAQVAAACGVKISAHDLRRTYCTAAESTEISMVALKILVNHSLGKDVTTGYIVITPERLRAQAQKVADKLKMLCGIGTTVGGNVEKLERRSEGMSRNWDEPEAEVGRLV